MPAKEHYVRNVCFQCAIYVEPRVLPHAPCTMHFIFYILHYESLRIRVNMLPFDCKRNKNNNNNIIVAVQCVYDGAWCMIVWSLNTSIQIATATVPDQSR